MVQVPSGSALKPGSLFMIGLPATFLDDASRQLIFRWHINNFILFRRNFKNRQQLRDLISGLRQACREAGLAAPIVAIDQEGGSVARLGPPFTQFPGARQMANSPDPEGVLATYARTCARELSEVGINLNLAPVLDTCETGCGYFMQDRALSADPLTVASLGRLVITEMQDCGLAACGKHFPGLGGAVVDPHRQLPVVGRSREDILAVELEPFRAAIDAGVAAIMTSHTVYPHLDGERVSTLSSAIITGLLRDELGYEGVVITDDLEMGAIAEAGSVAEAALKALLAGADLLLICEGQDRVVDGVQRVAHALERGVVSSARLERSFERLAGLRRRFGLENGNQQSL